MRLTDYARNVYTQFGEDGIIERIFTILGPGAKRCMEFGAGNGVDCSNTKLLRDKGWNAVLIEQDESRFREMENNAPEARLLHGTVSPDTINKLITDVFQMPLDLLSIDVDGDDWEIWNAIQLDVRLVIIEYNGSIPPHVSLRQAKRGDYFGASALALCDLARTKGYTLVSVTQGNLFFVRDVDARKFAEYETTLEALFPYEHLTYMVSDYAGHPALVGPGLPWGMKTPYMGATIGAKTSIATTSFAQILASLGETYGKATIIPASWPYNLTDTSPTSEAPRRLRSMLKKERPGLVVFDMEHVPPQPWLEGIALAFGYRYIAGNGVVAFILEDDQ